MPHRVSPCDFTAFRQGLFVVLSIYETVRDSLPYSVSYVTIPKTEVMPFEALGAY